MKKLLSILFILLGSKLTAQQYNNEWIDYSKAYYKFTIGNTGLYRITGAVLKATKTNPGNPSDTSSLAAIPAEQFQLWRNGKQVVLFTSITGGQLNQFDYIEFWGEQNDGKADKALYRDPAFQLSDKLSLQTDTAAYFLTVNVATPANANLRYVTDAATSTLNPEPYFTHTLRYNFREIINRGYAFNAGENVYSSSYDVGEFFSTRDIQFGSPYSTSASNFYTFSSGPAATLEAGFASNSDTVVQIQLGVNNNLPLIDQQLKGITAGVFFNNNVPVSVLTNTANSFTIKLNATNPFHRIVCNYIELKYPRIFDFDNSSNFTFTLPPSLQGFNLNISHFNTGSSVPVLYDITNNKRYITDVSAPGIVKVALPPSANARDLILVSESTNNITSIASLQPGRVFVNYKLTANQGDYLIVSNKILMSGANPVEQYRAYRSSFAGGSYNAKVYDIDELVDQFAYGIKKHPLSIKNFIRFAKASFTKAPDYLFIIGKGVTYDEYRKNENSANADKLNLVPTWGWPASDNLMVSADLQPVPSIGVGRLSCVSVTEVNDYLAKIKEYDQKAASTSQTLADKAWMKEMIHVVGADEQSLNNLLTYYLNRYEDMVRDTLYGGNVANFNKTNSSAITTTSTDLARILNNGISLLSYFGHSAASALSYNLNEPSDYSNAGKYFMFFANGCSAGNFFDYDVNRLQVVNSIAEKFVSAPNRGSIGFIGSTHFGITNYLDTYATGFYKSLTGSGYNQPVAKNMYEGSIALKNASSNFNDFFYRTHAEQSILNGDPAVVIYAFNKPDFVVEEPQVSISPSILSVADTSFTLKAYFYNVAKATRQNNLQDSVSVTIKRRYPDGTEQMIYNQKLKSVRFIDSVILKVPIIATRDKGNNRLTISIDTDNKYDELSELNNTVNKDFVVFDDAITTVYPYQYAIINKPTAKLVASTANPLSPLRNYIMEMDTTELFSSSFKITKTASAIGGIIEFDPGITYRDSTVYYWRVAQVPTNNLYVYSKSSFVYLPNGGAGYNQSQFYQHTHTALNGISLDTATKRFNYNVKNTRVTVRDLVYKGPADDAGINVSITLNDEVNSPFGGICFRSNNLTFTVFDSLTLKPMLNSLDGSQSLYNSMDYVSGCVSGKEYDFAFALDNQTSRNYARDFMDNTIPVGAYVVIRAAMIDALPYTYANVWAQDGTNSLYARLKSAGFADVDSFNRPRSFIFVYRKSVSGFTPISKFSNGIFDPVIVATNFITKEMSGTALSPKFGAAQKWRQLVWNGTRSDAFDMVNLKVIGTNTTTNNVDTLMSLTDIQTTADISGIDAVKYPNLQLYLTVKDTAKQTPYQLRYWRLLYDPIPEGAVAPAIKYAMKDTLEAGEQMNVSLAFKNISDVAFSDSIVVKLQVLDKSNLTTTLATAKLKKIAAGDTSVVNAVINTQNFIGNNTLLIDINPDNKQPEQFHFNNFVYKNFYVKGDGIKPLIDVTFDGLHILNNDIVSAKPNIRIKLKDESKFVPLDDTSLVTLQLLMPDNTVKRFRYNTDTLRFTPANVSTGENVATVDFSPYLTMDGDYTLTVTGRDKSNNESGTQQYAVKFTVYNKAMISNVFNYPNPFTSSTAFAFTLTGTVVPQNVKIQILTVTGKVVREITSDELGPLHIGNNITQFKWDGTDSYGSKLGNGVYLYRVTTNLNGNSLDKFDLRSNGNKLDTDKYFKAGYGKMYLMR